MSNDKMREEFEGWAVKNRYDIYRSVLGYYQHGTTDCAWKAWQAARAKLADEADWVRMALDDRNIPTHDGDMPLTLWGRVERYATQRATQKLAGEAVAVMWRNRQLRLTEEGERAYLRPGTLIYTAPTAQVPDGWRLVPVEPTFEMLKAIDQHGEYYGAEALKDAYIDMLSIAPQSKGTRHD